MTNEELKTLIFTALGEASMCWDPLPSNQVFEPTRAKEIGDKLVEKLLPILSQCEAMRSALEWYAEKNNWESFVGGIPFVFQDKGKRAKIILSHLGEGV